MKLEADILKEVTTDDSTSLEEKMFFYNLIKDTKPDVVVEIGTHRGLTSLYMAHALWENGKGHLHTCDPNEEWGQKGNFRKFPELEKHITFYPIKGKDLDVLGIDILFVDGFHEQEFVEEEIDHFLPRLNKGAIVIFHDCGHGQNEFCNPVAAIKSRNLETTYLDTQNGMMVYKHS